MEDAANHAKNDMSEIGHELPKKVTHPKIGFNLYMLNGIFMYCIKRFVSRNNISSMFHALSRNLIYDMFIIIIRNVYFDIELLRLWNSFATKIYKIAFDKFFYAARYWDFDQNVTKYFFFSRDILYISLFFRFQRSVVGHVRKFVLFWTGQKS